MSKSWQSILGMVSKTKQKKTYKKLLREQREYRAKHKKRKPVESYGYNRMQAKNRLIGVEN